MNKLFINAKYIIIFIGIVGVLYFIYLLVSPIYYSNLSFFIPRKLIDFEYACKYYSVLTSIFGVFLGLLGLILGAYYYKNKNDIEDNRNQKEKQRNQLKTFIDQLKEVDKQVLELLFTDLTQNELTVRRVKITSEFDKIVAVLNHGKDLLAFDESNIAVVLKVHSFVDRNYIIIESPYDQFHAIGKENKYAALDIYQELINAAFTTCYSKMKWGFTTSDPIMISRENCTILTITGQTS